MAGDAERAAGWVVFIQPAGGGVNYLQLGASMKRFFHFSLLNLSIVTFFLGFLWHTAWVNAKSHHNNPNQSKINILPENTGHMRPHQQTDCANVILYGDFEGTYQDVTGVWHTQNQASAYSVVAYAGNHGAFLPTFGARTPALAQTFNVPVTISNNTTAVLSLKKGVDLNFSGPSVASDQILFTLRRASDNIVLIPPILVANGVATPGIPDLDSANPLPSHFTDFNQNILLNLNPLTTLTPGDTVQATFYSPDPGSGTAFYLDNIELTFCTPQPGPGQPPTYLPLIYKNFAPGLPWHSLQISQIVHPNPVWAGGPVTYTLRYTVTGSRPSPGLTLVDTLPVSAAFQSCGSAPACAHANGRVVWALGDVLPPASGQVTVTAQLSAGLTSGAILTNTAALTDTTGLRVTHLAATVFTTPLDIAIVFDMSSSMQWDTAGYGFYEPFGDGATLWKNLNYGYGFPLPQFVWPVPVDHLPTKNIDGSTISLAYGLAAGNPALPPPAPGNTGQLCFGRDGNVPGYYTKGGDDPVRWIVAEGELYSLNASLLLGPARQPGRGYWAVQHTNWRTVHRMLGETWDPDSTYQTWATPILPTYSRGSWVSHHPYVSWAVLPYYPEPGIPLGHDYTLAEVRANPNDVPSLEYDFVTAADWDRSGSGGNNDNTRIWLRAQHGGYFADAYGDGTADTTGLVFWAVYRYDQLYGPAGGDPTQVTPLGAGNIEEMNAKPTMRGASYGGADGNRWLWGELTSDLTRLDLENGQRYVLKIWAGSVGFDIDRVVIGNQKDTTFLSAPSLPATAGSAFREACNRCNPIYGLRIASPENCTVNDNGAATVPGDNTDWGDPRQNMLFSGYQPLRSTKEAYKHFIQRLNPAIDQVGLVGFGASVPAEARVELRCLRYHGEACTQGSSPITYTEVLNRLEILPPNGSTNLAGGMQMGLEMLGVDTAGTGTLDNSCNSPTAHCSRGNAARRVLIIFTDGIPNMSPNNICKVPSLWPPLSGTHTGEDSAKDCVIYYGQIAARHGVAMYPIALGRAADMALLQGLADLPGNTGQFYATYNGAQLAEALDVILAEAR
jgi:hypothetical protein